MKILVIGGVAGGMSAAARARRLGEDAEIIVFERGPHVSFANCGLPYHIGNEIKDRDSLLLQTPESLRKNLNLDVRIHSEVVKIDRAAKKVIVKDTAKGETYGETYDKLVLAPGAVPVKPSIPGSDHPRIFTLRNIQDMDAIKSEIDKGAVNDAVILGSGYIGVELAENLVARKISVSMVQRPEQILSLFDPEMAMALQKTMQSNGITFHFGTTAAAFRETDGKILVELQNKKVLPADIVIISIGVKPDSSLAKDAGLKLDDRGGIVVDGNMLTSDPDIFAVGDAIEVVDGISGTPTLIPLAGPANRQGRIAADVIFGKDSRYSSTLGTAIVKVFEMTGASVGASEKALKKAGIPFRKIYLHPSSHAGYYPGATPIHIKMLFSDQGRILGAQAVGYEGVDKRIDVLATAIRGKMTVYDLENLELSYAPPYGSAKDPINMAGFIASNLLHGDVECWYPEDYPQKTKDGLLIDVRPPGMYEIWHIPEAINIPLGKLRKEIDKIPRDKDIFLYCKVGFTSYLAYRILKQKGFGASKYLGTLSGGATTFTLFHDKESGAPESGKKETPVSSRTVKPASSQQVAKLVLDACGIQCPGPIMKLKDALKDMNAGDEISVTASDPGFTSDVKAWCIKNGHELLEVKGAPPKIRALVRKGGELRISQNDTQVTTKDALTLVVFSGELDKVLAAFVIANGAIAMGKKVTMFFTFWGLNSIRRNIPQASGKGVMDFMFGEMMPKGADKLKLSQMNMCGIGTAMMKNVMKNKNVESLPSLMASAIGAGAQIVACSMSMDVMGIKKEELIDGVEIGGVATFLSESDKSSATLFI